MPNQPKTAKLSCSFCHKAPDEVGKVVAGPNVYICSECIKLCLDIITENGDGNPNTWQHDGMSTPAIIKEYLDQYVVAQNPAKRKLAVAVYNHYKRLRANNAESDIEVQKSNVLLIGPTGTGKTLMARTLARLLNVPFVIADATTLTEAGYVGEDVEKIILNLYQAADQDVEKAQKGIIYIDEIDKLAKKSFSSSVSRDVSGEGVQQALLKLLEGSVANLQVKSNKRLPAQEQVQIDTTNILFIVGGSFVGLDRLIEHRTGRRSVGYNREEKVEINRDERRSLLQLVTPSDLANYGLIPEFIGRLPVTAVMDSLEEEDLVHILTEPRNAIIKQYQKLLRFDKVNLEFTDDAIQAIAKKAVVRKSGARGLRVIMEKVMLEVMYEVPSLKGIKDITITKTVVDGDLTGMLDQTKECGISS